MTEKTKGRASGWVAFAAMMMFGLVSSHGHRLVPSHLRAGQDRGF